MSSHAGRAYLSLRDAIHATASGSRMPMKMLAGELDWSPSELSMRIALSGDNARVFPADDEHLVKLMRVTGDHSVLYTLADLMGYTVEPKRERLGERIAELKGDIDRAVTTLKQLSLELVDTKTNQRRTP